MILEKSTVKEDTNYMRACFPTFRGSQLCPELWRYENKSITHDFIRSLPSHGGSQRSKQVFGIQHRYSWEGLSERCAWVLGEVELTCNKKARKAVEDVTVNQVKSKDKWYDQLCVWGRIIQLQYGECRVRARLKAERPVRRILARGMDGEKGQHWPKLRVMGMRGMH